jgi:ribonuclease Y
LIEQEKKNAELEQKRLIQKEEKLDQKLDAMELEKEKILNKQKDLDDVFLQQKNELSKIS